MMDVPTFFKERERMCRYYKNGIDCCGCPLAKNNFIQYENCLDCCAHFPEEAVAAVENWSKEHPIRTYKSAFLEKFPDAELGCEDGAPYTCLFYIFGLKHAPDYCKRNSATCFKCWNREVEE
ncbi:hypothetical protein [Eubacterium callanderi]|uniref:hypothetical protein n=1 Tax=Eubacterium callanderi TaxID=53442 RepID=UPI001AA0B9AD|nr:hypothetical protein [Eubacterium callanderi]MBO1703602.1 hypothetical protein [Eubacterium callanderi]